MPASAQSITTSGDVTPSPASSPVWHVGVLNVGNAGEGTLTVEGGGLLISTYGQIGVQAGGAGTVTVAGSGSGWLSNSTIYVGMFGTGTLNIEDGGTVSNAQSGYIGNYGGSAGAVAVTGIGSTWANADYLSVGYMGSGALTITDGGRVTNSFGYIGANLGSIGTATVSGGGSSWENSGDLVVGQLGDGTLAIESGGAVSNATGHIGFSPGSIGTITVTGENSSWTNHSTLVAGNYGTGRLTVAQGGVVSSEDGGIGIQAGSFGTVTVRDVGSTWTMVNDLVIGRAGSGTVSVAAGGTVNNGFGYIGTGLGAESHVNITGAGSQWTNAHSLFVGDAGGHGTLLIENGGTVSNGYGVIGSGTGTGTKGAVIVTGENSRWSNLGDLNLGNSGTGTLTVEEGGAVLTGRAGYVGYGAGAFGAVTVLGEGSSWESSLGIYVGVFGNGELSIKEGGRVSGYGGTLGDFADSAGLATVSGMNSSWINTADVIIGNNGAGTLSVEDGGQVSNTFGTMAKEAGSKAAVTVTGNDSAWINSDTLYIGLRGTGALSVEDGGYVSNATGFIGRAGDAQGMVTVAGSGSAWDNDTLYVGTDGKGSLSVTNGGAVSNESAGFVGYSSGAQGDVLVTGRGSSWTSKGNLNVGYAGTGILTIADGATVTAASGVGSIDVASISSSTGTINIGAASGEHAANAGTLKSAGLLFGSGTGSLVFNHTGLSDGFVLDFAPDIAGRGTIFNENGNTVLNGDNSHFTGETEVTGGELTIADRIGGSASVHGGSLRVNGQLGGNVEVSDTGRIMGRGTIEGSLSLSSGGTLSGQQGQALAVVGDLRLDAGSAVDVALGGVSSPALFNVGGNLTLDGMLEVTDQGGFGVGVYRLFDYAGGLTDNGLSIGSTPAGVVADDLSIQTAVDGQINLVSTAGAELGFWDGGDVALHDNNAVDGGSGTWRADGRNWTSDNGSINGSFKPYPTFAIFQGTSGAVEVDNRAGAIGVTGMQFATDGYRVSGDPVELLGMNGETIIRVGDGGASDSGTAVGISATLSGASGVVKTGAGSLVLTGNNTYTGDTRISSGTMWLSSDANLGASSGAVIFDGGTLATTSGFTSGRAITFNDSARIDVFADRELSLYGAISGTGGLEKLGNGTLKLSGENTYGGDTVVRAGTLIGDAGSITGNIANAGTVVFEQGANKSFIGNIVGFGGLTGKMIKRGTGTLTLTGSSHLGWTVDAGELVSATNRFTSDLVIGADGSFTFDQDYAGSYAGTIIGSGALLLTGGGAVALTADSSGFAGTTALSNMTLVVAEALGGSLSILDGGRLEGTGTVGPTTVAAGGTLAPGNSIGTLAVDGDLSFAPGSRYEVEVNPQRTDRDLLYVAGNAALNGGAIAHIGATGEYELRSTYTIISAHGALSGTFDGVTSDFAFLNPDLIYDYGAGTVDLLLVRNDRDFASVALTPNQIATAQGIDSIGFDASDAVYDAVAQITADNQLIRASFDALSGEIHASAMTALIEDSRLIRNAANDRIRAAFGNTGASATPVLAYGPEDAPILVDAEHAGPAFWSHGFGSWGSADDDSNAASLDRATGGVLVGADRLVDEWRLGLLVGYSQSSFDARDRASSGSSNNYHLGLYGGTEWGELALRTGAAYTWHNIDTRRSVAIPGLADSPSADYSAATFQVFGELAHGLELDSESRLEPFANLAHLSLHRDGFGEQGGAATLTAASTTAGVTFTTLGLRSEHNLTLGTMDAKINGTVGWRYAFGDTTPESNHAFWTSDAF
ncbi:autotransporter domain-containing protein, partial [Ochrobactrum quorumnocens]|uniref:autotransporter domain-containing protein n=1 Tax=Ochrobactrum quorumnocens TaxID=271865 RepID=UPI0038521F8C